MSVWKPHERLPAPYVVWRLLEKSERTPVELIAVAWKAGCDANDTRDTLARLEGVAFEHVEGKWRLSMDRTKRLKSIDEFIEQAKRLRTDAEDAEARFLLFLREFEIKREDLWKTAGVAAFDGFLQSTQLCNTARYRNFVAGASIVHGEAEGIGANATIAAGHFRAPTEEATKEFVSRCGKFRDVHGVAPSEQTSREWVKQLDQAEPKVVRQANRLAQLEAENQQLRADKRSLERKLAIALKDIEKLEKQLSKGKPKAA